LPAKDWRSANCATQPTGTIRRVQGSVLGPLPYILYTTELDQITASHGLHIHVYVDDCQIYLSTAMEDAPLVVDKFTTCVADVITVNVILLSAITPVL